MEGKKKIIISTKFNFETCRVDRRVLRTHIYIYKIQNSIERFEISLKKKTRSNDDWKICVETVAAAEENIGTFLDVFILHKFRFS